MRQTSESSYLLELDGVIDFAGSFEVEEMQSFNDFSFIRSQERIILDLFLALLDLGSSSFKVILDFHQGNVLGETIGILDVIAIDDFWQFEEIESFIALQGFIEDYSDSDVAKEWRSGQLEDWQVIFVPCAVFHQSLEILVLSLIESSDQG